MSKQLSRKSRQSRATRRGLSSKHDKRLINLAVRRAVMSDLHYNDVFLGDTAVSNQSTYAFHVTQSAVGDTITSRTGNKILLNNLKLNFSSYRSTASASHDRLRVLVVRMKNQLSAAPDIYDFINSTSGAAGQVSAFKRVDTGTAKNYVIMKDFMIDLGFGTTDKSTKVWKYNKRFKRPLEVLYGTAGTANDWVHNGIYVLACSDVVPAGNPPFLNVQSRITFSE